MSQNNKCKQELLASPRNAREMSAVNIPPRAPVSKGQFSSHHVSPIFLIHLQKGVCYLENMWVYDDAHKNWAQGRGQILPPDFWGEAAGGVSGFF